MGADAVLEGQVGLGQEIDLAASSTNEAPSLMFRWMFSLPQAMNSRLRAMQILFQKNFRPDPVHRAAGDQEAEVISRSR